MIHKTKNININLILHLGEGLSERYTLDMGFDCIIITGNDIKR